MKFVSSCSILALKILPLLIFKVWIWTFKIIFKLPFTPLNKRFIDANIQASLHLEFHSRKQGPIESLFDYSDALEKSFLRLNITHEYYKLLLFLDGLQPHLQFDANKQGPTTYLQTKEVASNLESVLRKQARKYAATVDDKLTRLTKIDTSENSVSNLHRKQNRFSNFRPGQHPR